MAVMPYTEEKRKLDEFTKMIDFDNEDQVMEFRVSMSDLRKRKWWSKHREEYLKRVKDEDCD